MGTDPSPLSKEGLCSLPEPRAGSEHSGPFSHHSHTIKGTCFVRTVARLDLFGEGQEGVENCMRVEEPRVDKALFTLGLGFPAGA